MFILKIDKNASVKLNVLCTFSGLLKCVDRRNILIQCQKYVKHHNRFINTLRSLYQEYHEIDANWKIINVKIVCDKLKVGMKNNQVLGVRGVDSNLVIHFFENNDM